MRKILCLTILTGVLVTNIKADGLNDSSLGADIGTTGIGITAVKKLKEHPKWGIRVGAHKLNRNFTTTDNNADYDFDLKLSDAQLMADYHPWGTSFKWTFGGLYNGSKLDGRITPRGTNYTFNGNTYTTAQIGRVDTHVKFSNSIAPYIGIGWDTSFYKPNKSWGFSFNLGVFYAGNAKVTYTPTFGAGVPAATKQQIINDLEIEKASLEDDLNKYKYMPYISIGFNYKF